MTGLSGEDFEQANERRHWLAMLRIHKRLRELGIAQFAGLSFRWAAKICSAAARTCKAAFLLTYEQVLAGVRQAFIRPTQLPRDLNISRGQNVSKTAVQGEDDRGDDKRWLRNIHSGIRCIMESLGGTYEEKQCSAAPRHGKSERQLALDEQSRQIQKENEIKKLDKGDGKCYVVPLQQHHIIYWRKKEPKRFEEWVECQKARHSRYRGKPEQRPNSGAYRQS